MNFKWTNENKYKKEDEKGRMFMCIELNSYVCRLFLSACGQNLHTFIQRKMARKWGCEILTKHSYRNLSSTFTHTHTQMHINFNLYSNYYICTSVIVWDSAFYMLWFLWREKKFIFNSWAMFIQLFSVWIGFIFNFFCKVSPARHSHLPHS